MIKNWENMTIKCIKEGVLMGVFKCNNDEKCYSYLETSSQQKSWVTVNYFFQILWLPPLFLVSIHEMLQGLHYHLFLIFSTMLEIFGLECFMSNNRTPTPNWKTSWSSAEIFPLPSIDLTIKHFGIPVVQFFPFYFNC